MSRRLDRHLNPNVQNPQVLDSDGAIVRVGSDDRITDNRLAVNLGSSPNSNDGDPLRTAFSKINNFIEASYWTSDAVDASLRQLNQNGPFLGVRDYADFPVVFEPALETSDIRIGVLKTDIEANTINSFSALYQNITTTGLSVNEGRVVLKAGSILSFNQLTNKYDIVFDNQSNNLEFNYGEGLARLAAGTQESGATTSEQVTLYENHAEAEAKSNSSSAIRARNVEDALVELNVKFGSRGMDAGYYG